MSSIQLQRALDYFSAAESRDFSTLAGLLSEHYTHVLLPASLGGLGGGGMAVRNKEQFLELMKGLHATAFERLNFLLPKEIIQGQDVVVIHLTSCGKTKSGKDYGNEYVFTFRFEGETIVSVKEFLDSKCTLEQLEIQRGEAIHLEC